MEYVREKHIQIHSSLHFSDISPLFFGRERCESLHSFGPYVRDCYLIHFCLSGRGMLTDKYGEHRISSGELFIIRPGEVTVYTADIDDPWEYIWIAFNGDLASAFDCGSSVMKYPTETVQRLRDAIEREITAPYLYVSLIYELLHSLFSGDGERYDRLSMLRKYIKYNYMTDMKVEALARSFGFERSYLFRIFKKRYGMGIKEYITALRMEKAKSFLADGHSVTETASMVGYSDAFNFSKVYKKYFGFPPSKKRKLKNE